MRSGGAERRGHGRVSPRHRLPFIRLEDGLVRSGSAATEGGGGGGGVRPYISHFKSNTFPRTIVSRNETGPANTILLKPSRSNKCEIYLFDPKEELAGDDDSVELQLMLEVFSKIGDSPPTLIDRWLSIDTCE